MTPRELIVVLGFVFVDVLGFSLVLPLFPFLTKHLGMDSLEVGLLQASNALAQLIAVPFIGALSDKYGRRPMLLVCLGGTFVSFLLLGAATSTAYSSKFLLYFSRILDGLLGGNVSLAQTYICDKTSNDESRTKYLGFIGAVFGIGFIVGPAIGGTLTLWDVTLPSYLAGLLSFVNLLGVLFFLSESHPEEKRTQVWQLSSSLLTWKAVQQSFSQAQLSKALVIRLIYGVVFTMFEMNFGFYSKDKLGIDARSSSYLLTLYALAFAAVQAGGIKRLIRRFDEMRALRWTVAVLVALYFVSGVTNTFWQHALILVPLGIFSGIANTLITSYVSKLADPSLRGGQLGVSAALGASARIIAPVASGLLGRQSFQLPSIACALLCLYLSLLAHSTTSGSRSAAISSSGKKES